MLLVYGTRPEAVKLAPVARAIRRRPERLRLTVCTTGQHREMLVQAHRALDLAPDVDLDLMRGDQTLNEIAGRVLLDLETLLAERAPDWVLVQGDTTSAAAAALAAFHRRIRVGHVEAGLRTGDLERPFPEEANRRIVDLVADALFAPTDLARDRLLAEGVPAARIHVTGNTVVDALLDAAGERARSWGPEVLVTVHRRESFGAPLREILAAIAELAARFPDLRWIYPVHPNPSVRGPAREILSGAPNVDLCEPLDYGELLDRLARSRLVLTDSGGLQEEAPSFGKSVLVLRDVTERPEGIAAGVAELVGTDRGRIVEAATRWLSGGRSLRDAADVPNPYGDGHAAERIAAILAAEPWTPFAAGGPPRHPR